MPCDIHVYPEQRLAQFTAHGPLTVAAMIEALEHLRRDPRFPGVVYRLWDLRDATLTWTTADVQRLVSLLAGRPRQVAARRAAFVASAPVVYGLVRMFQIYAELAQLPTEIGVFHTRDEALAWLGVSGDEERRRVKSAP